MANQIARRLRKTMTQQEVKVWNHLRSWRKRGYHFRRQAPRKGYIVDFVCLKYGLVVEIDGGQHNLKAHATADEKRDQTLIRSGFRVLRFWNSDVDSNLDGILETIDAALMESKPHPATFGGHPPLSGEG
ncbi:MAG: endonuclease domain-containing protein [Rhizobiales bacterium]|nr:endonuclease domain-containing protein [Hyphomicrobiales bacterium]